MTPDQPNDAFREGEPPFRSRSAGRSSDVGESNPINSRLGRLLGGIFAGSIFGALIEPIFFWDGPPSEGIRLPWLGASLGAVMIGCVALFAGAYDLPAWFRRPAVGFLRGVVIGVLLGAFVYAPLITTIENGQDPVFHNKVLAAHRGDGVAIGAILGGVFGLVAGTWPGSVRRPR